MGACATVTGSAIASSYIRDTLLEAGCGGDPGRLSGRCGRLGGVVPRFVLSPLSTERHSWIAPTGAYNEHLIRDVGSAYLALFVVTLWALFGRRREMLLAGSAWTAFSVPHLVFHLAHLDEFGTGDKVGNIVTLAGTVVLSVALLAPERAPVRDRRVKADWNANALAKAKDYQSSMHRRRLRYMTN
jgi:hypothetical protein